MKLYIKPSELIFDHSAGLPADVADRMLEFHILPVNRIRRIAGYGITASQNSGYRTKQHEISKGRQPKNQNEDWSRHTYQPHPEFDPEGKGATDWRPVDLSNMSDFAWRMVEMTNYSRLCYYPDQNFIHSDFKHESRGRRLFIASSGGWKQTDKDGFFNAIR